MSTFFAFLFVINVLVVLVSPFPFMDGISASVSSDMMKIEMVRKTNPKRESKAGYVVGRSLQAGRDKFYYFGGQDPELVTQGLDEAISKGKMSYLPPGLVRHIGSFVPKRSPDFVYDWRELRKNVIELYDSRDENVQKVQFSTKQFAEQLKKGAVMFASGTSEGVPSQGDAHDQRPHAASLPCNSNFMQHISEKEKSDVKKYADGDVTMFKWRGVQGLHLKFQSSKSWFKGEKREITLMQDCVLVSQARCNGRDRVVYSQFDSAAPNQVVDINAVFHRLDALGQHHECPDNYVPIASETQTHVVLKKLQSLLQSGKLEVFEPEPANAAATMAEYDSVYDAYDGAFDDDVDDALFRAYLKGYHQGLESTQPSLLRRKHRN